MTIKWTALVTLAAMALYFATLVRVGLARGRTGLKAPATIGPPEFERAYRVQMNTLEGMPLFLPSLWLAALTVDDRLAAALGCVWIAGRVLYMQSYMADPAKRGPGFITQTLAMAVLFLMATFGVLRMLFTT